MIDRMYIAPESKEPEITIIRRKRRQCFTGSFNYLGRGGRVGLVEQRPYFRLYPLPEGKLAVAVFIVEVESLHYVLLGRFVRVQIELVEDEQRFLGVPVRRVGHPAARFHLIGIQTPEFQLLLEEGTAHVRRVVQLPRPIVVEDLSEDSRMSIEEVFVEDGVVVGQGFRQAGQSSRRDLLQGRLVGLVTDATDVQDHAVVGVRHSGSAGDAGPGRSFQLYAGPSYDGRADVDVVVVVCDFQCRINCFEVGAGGVIEQTFEFPCRLFHCSRSSAELYTLSYSTVAAADYTVEVFTIHCSEKQTCKKS